MELVTVKMLRTKLGKTQKEMADILGLTETTYRRRELNPKKFTFLEVKKMCQMADIPLENIKI